MSRRLFTDAERAILRAADHVVDQGEPGGALYHRDRDADADRDFAAVNAGRMLQAGATAAWRDMLRERRERGAA